MDVREKLVELILNADNDKNLGSYDLYELTHERTGLAEYFADYLIAHGVTVQELDGCKYCGEYEELPEHFINGNPVGRVFDTCIQEDENGLWHLEVLSGADVGIKFCPMCGKELPQPPKGE